MLGLADRSRVLDLMDRIIAADHKAALNEASGAAGSGRGCAGADQGPDGCRGRGQPRAGAEGRLRLRRPARMGASGPWRWRSWCRRRSRRGCGGMLLQGFEDCARAPDPPSAAQMVVLRLAAVTGLPSPEDAARMLAGGAAVPGPKSQPEPSRAPERADAPTATAPRIRRRSHGRPRRARAPRRTRKIMAMSCACRRCARSWPSWTRGARSR